MVLVTVPVLVRVFGQCSLLGHGVSDSVVSFRFCFCFLFFYSVKCHSSKRCTMDTKTT